MTTVGRCVMVAALLVDLLALWLTWPHGALWVVALQLASVAVVTGTWWRAERRLRLARCLVGVEAPAPEGVRVIRADGTVQPCELWYRGCEADGEHLWQVAGMVLGPGDRLECDVMPGHTGIEFEQAPPG